MFVSWYSGRRAGTMNWHAEIRANVAKVGAPGAASQMGTEVGLARGVRSPNPSLQICTERLLRAQKQSISTVRELQVSWGQLRSWGPEGPWGHQAAPSPFAVLALTTGGRSKVRTHRNQGAGQGGAGRAVQTGSCEDVYRS